MKEIGKLIKKELDKVFRFPRMVLSTIILPGLLIFMMYTIMGVSFDNVAKNNEEKISNIYVVSLPQSLKEIIDSDPESLLSIIAIERDEVASYQDQIKNEEADLLLEFPEDFDQQVLSHNKPAFAISYNSSSTNSNLAYTRVSVYLEILRQQKLQELEIDANIYTQNINNIYDEKRATGSILAMLLPMMIMIAVFAGCLGIGTDAIAGEKERGTLSTLLMLPIERRKIIFSKIISTVVITICSAVSTFIGVLASLPFAKSLYAIDASISYQFIDYLFIIIILIIIATLASILMLMASTFAKNIKEATAYGMPIYIIAIFTSVFTMFGSGQATNIGCIIPIYNCVIGLKNIFTFSLDIGHFLLIIASSLVYISLAIVVLVRMFKSEKVLFNK